MVTYISAVVGNVWTTGWNQYGQLGDGTVIDKIKFVRVIAHGPKAFAVAAGDIHSVVLKQDGSVWATGRNHKGQLGDGSTVDRNEFVKAMDSGAVHVAAGGYHSMVLKRDGSVWVTGCNEYGQLGDKSIKDRSNYVQAMSSGAQAIAAGSRHSMILKQDGSVWATGYNAYGQLGDGSTMNSHAFMQVILKVTVFSFSICILLL